ncbi:hypothetical protein CHS0354_029391 [Potamilus streckersoni]|uniref:G domain-containing protein n=1 Tax=Potamilus streckersoni TaxID=2493646 RepID=A0AAE0W1C0_9BIVA|nr:hypothetical protein CHS0354_029391 [Potamilus streckersoni]
MKQNRGAGGRGQHQAPKPWRNIDWSEENFQTLKKDVENFVPLQQQNQLKRMNILLLGQVSAGKSSIVNTITSIFSEHASHKAESTNSEKSVTRYYRQYQIRSRTEDELAFRLCDTKGIEDKETIRTEDIQRMIDGEKLDMETSEPSYDGSYRATFQYCKDKLFGFVRWMTELIWRAKVPDYNKRAYCVVYVIDSSNVQILSETVANYFKECRKLMKQNGGIPEIVLLTKADDCSEEVKRDLKAISHCPDIKTAVQKVMEKFGFEENQIYPVVNMLKDVTVRRETSILFLTPLRQILREGREYIHDMVDKKKMHIEFSGGHVV